MKSVIIGTAGHIDHGKTALVKALTGIDADRLDEEKRRGITIDLGFAHLALEHFGEVASSPSHAAFRFGFVDVPGHERFVRNMLAGAGGIDLVLLVISAAEGVMPQTREHFEICRLLNVRRGITVLTKSDMVEEDTLGVVRLEVEDFLRGSFLENAPIVAVSSKTGSGLSHLRRELALAAESVQAKDSSALLRLPIDRVFTMKGFGSVVTGTLISGEIRKEDEVELFPASRRLRIRGVQVHGESTSLARAGERTALNLSGIEKNELTRGMALASPGLLRTTLRLHVHLSLLSSARALRDRARVHFHANAAEMVAEVSLLGLKELRPGAEGFAHLHLPQPLLLLPGDRFIIRQFSPVVTIGGGLVLDIAPPRRNRAADTQLFLDRLLRASPSDALLARIERRQQDGLPLAELIAETALSREHISRLASALERDQLLLRSADLFISPAALAALQTKLLTELEAFHKKNPLARGVNKNELAERTGGAFELALAALVAAKKIELAGDELRLPGRGVVMKDDEAQAKRTIEAAFASAGLKVPALKEVLASLPLDRIRAQKLVTLLLRERVLLKLGDDLVFHHSALQDLRSRVLAYKSQSPSIDVARFKDLTGVSRKYAIPLLEFLDRERVTRREGDLRIIL